MKLHITVPSIGESITSADIELWEKQEGSLVKKGDIIALLETDKASLEIPAPQDGILSILKKQGSTVSVGDVIATIDTDKTKTQVHDTKHVMPQQNLENATSSFEDLQTSSKSASTAFQNTDQNLSPATRRLMQQNQILVTDILGTGRDGRITKQDVLVYLENKKSATTSTQLVADKNVKTQSDIKATSPNQKREAMTRFRKKLAQKLVQSQNATATLSTFNEVDFSRIIEIRKKYQEAFVKKHGVKLGFMSFAVKAVVFALKAFPRVNAFIDETDIIYNNHQHIGMAVSTQKGLVVPVLFNADNMHLADIEKQIIAYRNKATSRNLTPDDLMGGTFTISNGGVFGSLLSTPLLNPPQSGILGLHKIEERPIVKQGKIVIRPMMYLALSYDHRIIDGRESVGFLVKVKEALEEPARLIMDI